MTAPAILADQRAAEMEDAERAFASLPKGDLLYRYQQRTNDALFAGTQLLVVEKSRRIGLTWGVAAYAVLRAASQRSAGGMNIWYMGNTKEMTREFIDACAMWARAFGIGAEAIDLEMFEDDNERDAIAAFRIRFASGFKIVALPSVPSALRGKQGAVIIDEAAFHKDLKEVLKAALALLILGGQVVVISTHDGAGNPFNVLCDEVRAGRRRGQVITITFADAIADGLYERTAQVARSKGVELPPKKEWEAGIRSIYTEDEAAEELDCIPSAGSGSLIKPADITACEHPDAGRSELYSGGLMIAGRDVARRRDGQITWGFELVGDVMWLRDRREEVGRTFAEEDAYFDWLFANRRMLLGGIDQTGMGEKVVEDAKARHGDRVVGFLLTGPTRLELGLSLAMRFEAGKIRVPPCPKIRADLLAIKKAASAGGGVRLVNEGDVHADRFWAGGIASRLGDFPPTEYGYHSARPPAGPRDGGGRRMTMQPDHSSDWRPGRGGGGLW